MTDERNQTIVSANKSLRKQKYSVNLRGTERWWSTF